MGAFDGATREQTTGPTMWPRVAMIPASSCTPGGRLQTVVYIRPAPIPHEFSPTPTNYLYNLQITRTFHYNTRQSRNVCISPLSNFSKVNFHPLPKKMTNVMQNSAAHMGTESVMINKKEPVRQDTTWGGYASPPREMPVKESSLSVRLNDGNEIPQVALGVYKAPNGQETEDAVTAALDAGYRHIDSAARYMNEEACGRALNAWLMKTGTPREDVFVTTKLWDADHGYEPTFNALNDSLKKFGLDYFDLYLIHSPSDDEEKRVASWRALEMAQRLGLVRSIGVSNFGKADLEGLLENASVVPAVNQIEVHPFCQREELVDLCHQNGIVVEAYSPLARGNKLEDERVVALAEKYGKSPAQILLTGTPPAATSSSPSPSPHTASRATCSPSASPSPPRTCRRLIASARRTMSQAPSTSPTTRSIHNAPSKIPAPPNLGCTLWQDLA